VRVGDRKPVGRIDRGEAIFVAHFVTHIRTYGHAHSDYHITALFAGEHGKNQMMGFQGSSSWSIVICCGQLVSSNRGVYIHFASISNHFNVISHFLLAIYTSHGTEVIGYVTDRK
jgi:hypothetical protein